MMYAESMGWLMAERPQSREALRPSHPEKPCTCESSGLSGLAKDALNRLARRAA